MSIVILELISGGLEDIMETIDIIRQLCADKGISLSQLENELNYGNGSLAKVKNMSADRIFQISRYFGVSMEYLITGKTINEVDDEMAILRQKQSILLEMNKINTQISDYYKKISDAQNELTKLKNDFMKLENKDNPSILDTEPDSVRNLSIFDIFPEMKDDASKGNQ